MPETEEERLAREAEKEKTAAHTELDDKDPNAPPESQQQEDLEPPPKVSRDEIVAKARDKRMRDLRSNFDDLDEEGRRRTLAMEAEVRGEEHEYDITPEGDPDPAPAPEEKTDPRPAAKKADETVDTEDDLVTIKIDGEERQVPRTEVEEAGRRALQKEIKADETLKEAKEYEKSVRRLETAVRKRIETHLQARAQEGADVDGNATPPTEGAVAEAVQQHAERVSEAIYSGDQEQVQAALTELVTGVVQGRPQESTPPQVSAEEFAQQVMADVQAEVEQEEAEQVAEERRSVAHRVNTTFKDEFPELYESDDGFALAQSRFNRLCADRPEADRVDLMREAAKSTQKTLSPPAMTPIEARRRAKAGADAETPVTSERREEPKAPARRTRTDVVADLQRARGQR